MTIPANEDESLPEGILVSEERLGSEDTPANEWREEFDSLYEYETTSTENIQLSISTK